MSCCALKLWVPWKAQSLGVYLLFGGKEYSLHALWFVVSPMSFIDYVKYDLNNENNCYKNMISSHHFLCFPIEVNVTLETKSAFFSENKYLSR